VFLTICAVFTLERRTMAHPLNHFALRAKLYVKAIQQALRTRATDGRVTSVIKFLDGIPYVVPP
jgi:hypothetical protein